MKFKKTLYLSYKYHYLAAFLFLFNVALGQNVKQEKMGNLEFMVGQWIGTSTVYKNEEITKQAPAFQKISYDLDKSILVIKLNSKLLQLHTIIYYDEKDETYYYFPFSKRGVNKLPATYDNQQFIVKANENTRYVFEKTGVKSFREYGEKLKEGKWVKFFEDNFTNTQ
ncbi:hypothetical protein [Aquimarina algiphila]|uniref:Uncharacterized protein n=1 Tax=Aquimarina algiphila TaxID=2047982 RepID=A0A554VCN1_9FLAO|nr:hypothetical protein [Aquimarina algiphila]TSE04502.1 hypothetical protein FOF46_26205 [Aquimarina algiphila]